MKKPKIILLISLSVLLVLFGLVHKTTTRPLNDFENILLQIIFLAIGSGISFFAGQKSAREAAGEILKLHARSAFRRLLSLYQSLSRAATVIESAQSSKSDQNYQVILARLEEIITEQLATADDALDDWNDIVPEDVAELKQKLQSDNTTEDKQ